MTLTDTVAWLAKSHLARRLGLDRRTVDRLGEPTVDSLETDPVIVRWPGGTELEIPRDALAVTVAVANARRDTLN